METSRLPIAWLAGWLRFSPRERFVRCERGDDTPTVMQSRACIRVPGRTPPPRMSRHFAYT